MFSYGFLALRQAVSVYPRILPEVTAFPLALSRDRNVFGVGTCGPFRTPDVEGRLSTPPFHGEPRAETSVAARWRGTERGPTPV